MRYLAVILALCCVAGTVPDTKTGTLQSKESHTYSFLFEADVFARLEATGTPGSELDCSLKNKNGDIVAIDYASGNTCSFLWIPSKDETFTIQLLNTGKGNLSYRLETN
jgi:hypothetical protein